MDESRLARDELVAATIRSRLKDHGVKLASPGRGEFDLDDPSDAFTSSVLSAAHALEQAMRTAKMKAGLRRTAEAGYWPGGPAPFGCKLIADPEGSKHKLLAISDRQHAALRRAYDLVINEGLTVYATAPILNAEGYVTQRGRPWRHENLAFQLHKPHLTGTWTYNQGDDPIEVQIPAIFTVHEWKQLQAAIKGKPRPQRKNRLYKLTGRGRVHLQCSCGGNYFGKRDSSKKDRAYYECSRNKLEFGDERCEFRPRIIQAIHMDDLVWNEVVAKLTDPDYLRDLASEVLDDVTDDDGTSERGLLQRLGELQSERTAIVRALAKSDQLAALNEQIDTLVATARDRMANPSLELMAEMFDLLDIDLVRIGNHQFEGTGSIPLPEDGGEVWEEGPQRLYSNLTALRFGIEVTVQGPSAGTAGRAGADQYEPPYQGSKPHLCPLTRERTCANEA